MPALEENGKIVDLQEYRQRRAKPQAAMGPPLPWGPFAFVWTWVPVVAFVPLWSAIPVAE